MYDQLFEVVILKRKKNKLKLVCISLIEVIAISPSMEMSMASGTLEVAVPLDDSGEDEKACIIWES